MEAEFDRGAAVMLRLNMLVEGQTEEGFVKEVLFPHLHPAMMPIPRIIAQHRLSSSYLLLKNEIGRWLKQDKQAYFTTMIDLYALPPSFPAYDAAKQLPPPQRVQMMEEAWAADIGSSRFIPYIQLHEYEALLLSDPQQLDWEFLEHDDAIERLVLMAQQFQNPEWINDTYETAPSRRISAEIPEYADRKSSAGVTIARMIGLNTIRAHCPHFSAWIARLEQLT